MTRFTPLQRHPIVQTDNPAELLDALRRTFRSEFRAGGPMPASSPAEVRGIIADQFSLGIIDSRLSVKIAGGSAESSYFVDVVLSGDLRSARDEERIVCSPGLWGVFNPGDRHHLTPALTGTRTLGIRLHRDVVEQELTNLAGRPLDGPLRFDFALDLTDDRARGLQVVLDTLLRQYRSDHALFDHPAVQLVQLRTLVTALLLSHRHNFSEALLTGHSPLRPRSLRRALDFIEENLGEPITLGDIAAAAGCSARTLNDAFRDHFGASPMQCVRNRRLDRVRQRLTETRDSVSDAATSLGFGHLGRLSAAYQQRFGELPSETVRRR